MFDHLRVQGADAVAGKFGGQVASGPTGQVYTGFTSHFVHGQHEAEAPDATAVTKSLIHGLTQRQCAVLNAVVAIHLQVALAFQLQCKTTVHGQLLHHVIQETDTATHQGLA